METINPIYSLVAWNLFVFLLYGLDKWLAKQKQQRITEKVLMTASMVFGGFGAVWGMLIFHHKVNKSTFRIGASVALLLTVIGALNILQGKSIL